MFLMQHKYIRKMTTNKVKQIFKFLVCIVIYVLFTVLAIHYTKVAKCIFWLISIFTIFGLIEFIPTLKKFLVKYSIDGNIDEYHILDSTAAYAFKNLKRELLSLHDSSLLTTFFNTIGIIGIFIYNEDFKNLPTFNIYMILLNFIIISNMFMTVTTTTLKKIYKNFKISFILTPLTSFVVFSLILEYQTLVSSASISIYIALVIVFYSFVIIFTPTYLARQVKNVALTLTFVGLFIKVILQIISPYLPNFFTSYLLDKSSDNYTDVIDIISLSFLFGFLFLNLNLELHKTKAQRIYDEISIKNEKVEYRDLVSCVYHGGDEFKNNILSNNDYKKIVIENEFNECKIKSTFLHSLHKKIKGRIEHKDIVVARDGFVFVKKPLSEIFDDSRQKLDSVFLYGVNNRYVFKMGLISVEICDGSSNFSSKILVSFINFNVYFGDESEAEDIYIKTLKRTLDRKHKKKLKTYFENKEDKVKELILSALDCSSDEVDIIYSSKVIREIDLIYLSKSLSNFRN